MPFSIFIVAAVFAAVSFLTRKTALGLFIESVGCKPTASRLAGVRSKTVMLAVYLFCGLCAGIAGLILSSNVSSADGNNAGLWYELDAILAVVIGGTLLTGGVGYVVGTFFGVLIQGVIQTIISFEGTLSSWWTRIVIGVLLLLFILLQRLLSERRFAGRS